MLEFDQFFFFKIHIEINISCFQKNKETKKIHVSLKDEMWSQKQMQKWQKSLTKMIDSLTPLLDQPFWQYLCLLSIFLSFFPSEDVVTIWLVTSSFTNSTWFLKFMQLFNWMAQNPPMIFKSLVWIIPPRKRWLYGIWWSQSKKSRV